MQAYGAATTDQTHGLPEAMGKNGLENLLNETTVEHFHNLEKDNIQIRGLHRAHCIEHRDTL